jgi:hypothetical protein
LQELPPGRDVAAATLPGPIDRPMERFQYRLIERDLGRFPSAKPAAEMSQQAALLLDRRGRIAQPPQIVEKSSSVTHQAVTTEARALRRNAGVTSLIHRLPPSDRVKSPTEEHSRIIPNHQSMVGHNLLMMNENEVIPRPARNNPVLGIMPQRVWRHTLLDPRGLGGGTDGAAELAGRQRLNRVAAGKQPASRQQQAAPPTRGGAGVNRLWVGRCPRGLCCQAVRVHACMSTSNLVREDESND